MNVDQEMGTTTPQIVLKKIKEGVVVTEEIVHMVVATDNLPVNAITMVKQVIKMKIVGRKIKVRSE